MKRIKRKKKKREKVLYPMMDTIWPPDSCLNDGFNQDRLCEASSSCSFSDFFRAGIRPAAPQQKRDTHTHARTSKRLEQRKAPVDAFKDHKKSFSQLSDEEKGKRLHALTRLRVCIDRKRERERVIT
jgi:hypothetical protein